jgi:hypothetical protein
MPNLAQDKKIAAAIDRVFTDPTFAKSMQKDPAGALASAGLRLNAMQKERLGHLIKLPEEVVAISWTRPVVRILTKGTQPAVQVLVKTVVVAQVQKEKDSE